MGVVTISEKDLFCLLTDVVGGFWRDDDDLLIFVVSVCVGMGGNSFFVGVI